MVQEQSMARLFGVAALGTLLLIAATVALQGMPVADLLKDFGIPSSAGAVIVWLITDGALVVTIVAFLVGLGTGGLGLIAAAGKTSLKVFLKKKKEEMGSRAFIAW